jgi:hypothetical protein
MIMHPQKSGVAIASLTAKGMPKNGFLDSPEGGGGAAAQTALAERNANAHLIVASPELFHAAMAVVAYCNSKNSNIDQWPESFKLLALAVGKIGAVE